MKLKVRKRLSAILSIIMFVSVFANSGMVVFASETNIEASDYVQDENDVFVYCAVDDTAYGTITVPEGYVFLVEDGVNVTAGEINLASGAQLTIFGTGTLTCSTITASDGATMLLGSNANIPSGVTAVYDGENNITGDTAWEWFTFIYDNGTWYANIEPPFEEHYDFCINGLEDGDTYTVEYSYDGNTYVADGVGIDENENGNCWVDIQEIPGEWNNKLYFRVVLILGDGDSKELLEYGFGWNGESYAIGMGYPEAGEEGLNVVKDTYQLTFCYPDVTDGLYPHDIHLQVGVPGEEPEEPQFETHYDFCINGLDLEGGDTYSVEYSYDGNTYVADGVGIDENENGNCWVDIQSIPEGWDNKLYFRVVLTLGDGDSKELLEYGFGWNGESYTIGMDYPEAGEEGLNVVKDTYQLTFCYPDVSEGLYPHDIHLQVGVPEDPEEPEETETTVTFRVENYDNADGSHNATGTVYYKFNTDENFTSVTAANMIDGTFSLEIPEDATTVTVKAVADTGSEVNKYNIDFPVSNSGNFINEENVDEIHAALTGDGYVFDLSVGSPEFCIRFTQEGAKHYILWNTLSWGGGNVTLENGTVECKKIIFDGKTYTTDSSEVNAEENIYSISAITNEWNTAVLYRKLENDDIGYDIFVLPYSPAVEVEFELMPAKGYQIASIPSGAMDDQLSEENDIITAFVPQEASATYRYTFDGSRNIHYVPTFSEGTNTAEVTGGSSVTSADVATGNNNIAGNLGLSVAEITESNASSPIKEAVAGADAVYLNIDLNQIISKGAGRGEWETSLTELENEVTISLDVAGYDSNKSYYIVREHDGTCDRLEATYNTTTGKLEFATDRFSTYAIICTDAQTPGGGENPGGEAEGTYTVWFGEGSWEIGDVTVTTNRTDVQYLAENDIITLQNFDAETMEARVDAEDGFWTTLAVTDGQTSISAHTNDGGVPTDIAFSVVEKSTGGGEVNNGNAVQANVTVNISGEELEYDAPWSNDAADFVFGINGSEMRRLSKEEVNYTTEGDKIVGLATKEALGYEYNYDDSGNVTFNIKTQWDDVITSLTINGVLYDTPQTKDDLINAFDADFRGIRFDIENVPYAEEYHIVVEGRKQTQEEKIMGNFGWTYDPNSNEYSDDDKIPYGNLEFVEAKYNGVTYDSIEEVNEAGGTFQWDDGVKGTDDPTGDAMFPTGTELTLRLIPDAGYQLTSLELNGTPFEPGEEVGLYTFTIGGGNWHLGARFTQVGAEVQASSVNIKSGNIDINENFEYGTAKLEVSDVASMDSSRMEEFENTATDEGYEIENYLDISLYNAVYKGGIKDVNGNYESWDTSVENIENKAVITLELENDMSGKDLAVIHELHNGEEIIGYELIDATYNEENNTITFESDSFSHYAIVSKGIGEGENVYYIDLGTGSWTVGDVTVSTPEGTSGVVSMLDTETIPTEMLANFDPETMDITLTVSDGFVIYLEIDENGNTTLVSTRDGVELPPYGETLIFSVVKKPETESYTLTDDKGNVISLTYEKNRELSFTMIDYLAFSLEDLETAGISQEFYDSAMKGIKNATKQHGTLLSFYEIQVENDDGYLIHEGPFYIKIKMTDEMKKYDIFKIVYIDVEDNLATESPITLTQEGGYLVGTLEHLSTYALVGDNAPGENDAPADSDTSAPTSPQTGDNSNLGLWVFLLVLSSCSMIALIVIDKKRKIAK